MGSNPTLFFSLEVSTMEGKKILCKKYHVHFEYAIIVLKCQSRETWQLVTLAFCPFISSRLLLQNVSMECWITR